MSAPRGPGRDDETLRSAVPPEVWESIVRRCPRVTFADGEALMHHGSSGTTCYVIVEGRVLVTTTSTQGATLVLGRRGPGELVGELAALAEAPRTATVTARGDVAAHAIRRDELVELLDDHPSWAVTLLVRTAVRLRDMTERYSLRSEDLRRRLCDVLATNLDETGDATFRSTREELAGWVGATREATVRVLQELRSDGAVTLGRGTVTVVDRSALGV